MASFVRQSTTVTLQMSDISEKIVSHQIMKKRKLSENYGRCENEKKMGNEEIKEKLRRNGGEQHCGTKPGHYETSNQSLSHELGSECTSKRMN